jgi:AbrB family looped-hinge helix DNA binding protein
MLRTWNCLTWCILVSIFPTDMENHINMTGQVGSFGAPHIPHLYGSVKVGERGQVVIPQEARTELNLQPGDKLLALGGIPGLQGVIFVKADSFSTFLMEISRKVSAVEGMLRATEAGQEEGRQSEQPPADRSKA